MDGEICNGEYGGGIINDFYWGYFKGSGTGLNFMAG